MNKLTKKVSLVFLLFLSLSLLTQVSKAIAIYHFYGYVREIDGTTPAVGVKVTLYKGGTTYDIDYTDGNGRYDVYTDPLRTNLYVSLRFEKSGYITQVKGAMAYASGGSRRIDRFLSRNSLDSDWGRHPSDSRVSNEAISILGSNWETMTDYEKAYGLWYEVKEEWTHNGGWNGVWRVRKDYNLITEVPEYTGACYSAAILLTGLCRSVGVKARMILVKFERYTDPITHEEIADEHVFTEIYVGTDPVYASKTRNGWLTACADYSAWGWWGWDGFENYVDSHGWEWNPSTLWNDVDEVKWVFEVTGTDFGLYWDGYLARSHDYDDSSYDSYWNTWDDYKAIFA